MRVLPAISTLSLMFTILTFPSLQKAKASEWTEIKPGGATACARGDDYAFFVSPGSSNKVIIDFIGGGACWSAETCAKESATFNDNIDVLRRRRDEGQLKGIYNRENSQNPLKDWNHIIVPYCTGDIHWGNNVVEYTKRDGSTFNINHKGGINTQAVLRWAKQNFAETDQVVVTGCKIGRAHV